MLSTLHTNSAPETVTRLLDMGMDPFNFADSLLAVLAQRLVRRLCNHCRVIAAGKRRRSRRAAVATICRCAERRRGWPPPTTCCARWLGRFGRDGRLAMHHSPGCEQCDHTGLKGRAGLHELMVMSRELRRLIQTGARAEELQGQALSKGMRTLRQDGIERCSPASRRSMKCGR